MINKLKISEFLLSVETRQLKINTKINEIHGLLGGPDDVALGKIRIERFLGGRIEVSYINEISILIALYLKRGIDNANNVCLVNDLPVKMQSNRTAFSEWLLKENISFTERNAGEGYIAIETQHGVTVGFDDNELITIQISLNDNSRINQLIKERQNK